MSQKPVTVGTSGSPASLDTNFQNIQDNFVELYSESPHGEFYKYENSTETEINIVGEYHALVGFTVGLIDGFTFVDGIVGSGTITTGAAGAAININDAAHGLVSGDYVAVQSANHSDLAQITLIDINNFTVPITYVGDETVDWQRGSYLQAGNAGAFRLAGQVSGAALSAKVFKWELAKNDNKLDNTAVKRSVSGNFGAMPIGGLVELSVGDRVYMVMKNYTDDANFTVENANLSVFRV